MKKYIFLWLLLASLPNLVLGQAKFKYEVSKPYRVIDAATKAYFSKDGKMLSIKIDGKDIYMQSFDIETMKEITREKISDMPKGYVVEDVAWFGNKIFFYYSLWDRKNTTEQLFAREVDFEGCKFKDNGKRIVAVEGKLAGPPMVSVGFGSITFRLTSTPKFDFLYSKDRSKLLVQYRRVPLKRRDAVNKDIIGMFVFDNDLEKISGRNITMPYTEKKMDNLDYSVDKEGNTYILTKVRLDNSNKNVRKDGKDKISNYRIELLKIPVGTTKIEITKVSLDNKFINGIWLFENNEDEMLCAGYYNKSASDNADGVFLFKVDKEGGINDQAFHEIPVEVLNQYKSNRNQKKTNKADKKGKAEFAELVLDKLVLQDDGSMILMGEQYYVVVYYDSKGRARYVYHYNDILVTKIDADGTLAWMKKLPKRQQGGRGQGTMSYRHIKNGDSHCFVFLDNVKNIDLAIDEVPARHQDGLGGYLTAYKVDDETGKVKKYSIFNTKEVKGDIKVKQFSVNRVLKASEEAFILELYKGKKEDVIIKVQTE